MKNNTTAVYEEIKNGFFWGMYIVRTDRELTCRLSHYKQKGNYFLSYEA